MADAVTYLVHVIVKQIIVCFINDSLSQCFVYTDFP